MTDDMRLQAPTTLAGWQTALRATADLLVTAEQAQRPARAGNIAGALRACADSRHYNSRGVEHNPNGTRTITITAGNGTIEEIQAKLSELPLPGIASVEFARGEAGQHSKLILAPYQRPAL